MILDNEDQRKLLLDIFNQVSPKGTELILSISTLIIAVRGASVSAKQPPPTGNKRQG